MSLDWYLTESAIEKAKSLGVAQQEMVSACEHPDWVYESTVHAGTHIANGGRLSVTHDMSNKVILSVSWRHETWRRPLGQ